MRQVLQSTPVSHLRLRRWLPGVALAVVLAVAFAAYLQPSFVLDLANRIVMCF